MRIVIEFDSCWQTGFLDGDSNLPVSKKNNPRKFIATSGTRGEKDTPISDNTVIGLLYRLIGDQRKLYQVLNSDKYRITDIEAKMSWRVLDERTDNELVYLTNKSDGRCAQGAWLGVLPDNTPWFFSENAPLLWSVLFLERDEILDFINFNSAHNPILGSEIDCRPTVLLSRLAAITDIKSELGKPWKKSERIRKEIEDEIEKVRNKKERYIETNACRSGQTEKQKSTYENKINGFDSELSSLQKDFYDVKMNYENQKIDTKIDQCVNALKKRYPDCEFLDDGQLYPQRIYASALYEQAARLIGEGINLSFVLETKGKNKGEISIKGFSKDSKAHRGFNGARDWLNPMSGGRKKAVGTPCRVNKQSGRLEINLNIDRGRAIELKTMIDNAGVSAFYLGKKGLAYVADIRV